MTYVILRIPNEKVGELAPLISPRIESALEHARGEITTQDLINQAAYGDTQVWTIQQACDHKLVGVAVTQVVAYPRTSALRVVTLGGERFDEWARQLDDVLTAFSKEQKLSRLEAFGRKGFAKKLEVLAFHPAYTAFVKEIA